jgi:hypothetical protein
MPFVLASPVFAETMAGEQDGPGMADGEAPTAIEEIDEADDEDTDEPAPPPPPVSIDITRYPANMTVGDRDTIKYEVNNAEADAKVKWVSGDEDIATVDSDGEVRAFAAGKVEITASLGDARASILISIEEKVIPPESFTVEVEEFSAADTLLSSHELAIGDELHLSAKISPPDADINGKFEWDTSSNGVVAVETAGDINENATLTAKSPGEATLTVKYVDEPGDESGQVSLDDYKLVVSIPEVEEEATDSLLTPILIAAAAIALVTLITVGIVRGRRRAEYERRARAARKKREMAERRNAADNEREKLMTENYERGYMDSEADRFDRKPSDYDDFPTAPSEPAPPDFDAPEFAPPEPAPPNMADRYEPLDEDDEPEKPFSVDDIE